MATLLRGLHPDIKRKVRAALDGILESPEAGKALKEELDGLCSYRVGRLRIIYRNCSRSVVDIVAVGPRRVIYEETLRLLRKGSPDPGRRELPQKSRRASIPIEDEEHRGLTRV
ncbi:MAG: type II toxin-antitoxin system RelE/ParE family toxin [Deltaproteobacteria bacterium]|nr:type II toxin-antitoxin system RelE/ParE family toxin [Deltaproteobacteria bacterium]